MKIILILITILISGCATNKDIIQSNLVIAPSEIMYDCDDYIKPKDGTMEDLINVILENKKIYSECNTQNKEKKNFIIRQQNY